MLITTTVPAQLIAFHDQHPAYTVDMVLCLTLWMVGPVLAIGAAVYIVALIRIFRRENRNTVTNS